jgi:hypothetical protein
MKKLTLLLLAGILSLGVASSAWAQGGPGSSATPPAKHMKKTHEKHKTKKHTQTHKAKKTPKAAPAN